jgi:hypothetical protein
LVEVGRSPGGGYIVELEADGSHAFVIEDRSAAVIESVLRVIDASDPMNPLEVAEMTIGDERTATFLEVTPDAVFVAASYLEWNEVLGYDEVRSEIRVYERTSPSTLVPRDVVSLGPTGYATALAADGALLYTIELGGTLRMYDISNPSAVVPLASTTMDGEFSNLHIEGSTLLLTEIKTSRFPDNLPGLRLFDLSSNPLIPIELGFAELPLDPRDVDVVGTTAVVALRDGFYDSGFGIHTIDIADPSDPQPLTRLTIGYRPDGVRILGSKAFVSTGFRTGIYVVDVSVPASPAVVANFLPGDCQGLAIVEGAVAVADADDLVLVDLADQSRPFQVETVPANLAFEVVMRGSIAYVASGVSGLRILDLSDPSAPILVGSLSTAGETRSLLMDGMTVYLAEREAGIRIVDVTDPTSPSLLGALDTPEIAERLDLAAGHLYVADRDGGMRIIDVSDPTQPTEIASVASESRTWDVDVDGSRAYMADGGAGLRVFDVSDPTQPTEIGVLVPSTPTDAYVIEVLGDLAYIGEQYAIRIADVSEPVPVELDVLGLATNDLEIVNGNRLVVASPWGVRVFDTSNPEALERLGGSVVHRIDFPPAGVSSIGVVDGLVYAAVPGGIEGVIGVVDFGSEYALGPARVGMLGALGRLVVILVVGMVGVVGRAGVRRTR